MKIPNNFYITVKKAELYQQKADYWYVMAQEAKNEYDKKSARLQSEKFDQLSLEKWLEAVKILERIN